MGNTPESLFEELTEHSPELQELQTPEGDLHLRFFTASGDEFALPAIEIREVVAAPPDRITPIPNVSPLLLGILNLRGQVIWVVDVGQFIEENTAPVKTDRAEIPVIAIESQEVIVGLAVEHVVGMEWLNSEALRVAANVPDNIAPFLRGEWMDESLNHPLRLLDSNAIIRSARWAA